MRTDDYLARAAECDRLATTAADAEMKRQFAEIARHWRELAKSIESVHPKDQR
jgi:hypothetical protein